MDIDQLEKLFPFTESFEYCAQLGLNIRMNHYHLWQEFEKEINLQKYPLNQAQAFKFIEFLENKDKQQLLELSLPLLNNGPDLLKRELQASLDCLSRDYTPGSSQTPPELFGSAIMFHSLLAKNYLNNPIDQWTEQALTNNVQYIEASRAKAEQIVPVHHGDYYHSLLEFAELGGGRLTPETIVVPDSTEAIHYSCGGLLDALKLAKQKPEQIILCQSHPGSHHARENLAGGTCLINNLAVAADQALKRYTKKVAILDIDAHHGNGTESIFYQNPNVFTASVHQSNPFFPGTGNVSEQGLGRGHNTNYNLPINADDDWKHKVTLAFNWLIKQRPGLLLVEFSTDAHIDDPVSDLKASNDDYYYLGQLLSETKAVVIVELGASLSKNAWIGGLRSLINGYSGERQGLIKSS
jgi:acetoin utilization deacetylase AcuC-like enzyme